MAAVSPQPVSVVPGQVVTQDPSSSTLPRNRRDSFQRLSAVPVVSKEGPEGTPKHGHHGQNLPCCLILYVSVLAVLCGFLVSGCHKAFVYSGCLLGINGCNSLNGYKYEKMGYILIKQFSEVPEEVIYILSSVTGAALCGLIIVCLPKHLQEQVKGGGTCQSLVAVATGKGVPLSAAVLRITLAVLFLMSGGSMGAEGPSIQVCTSFAMLAGWYSGIRAPVTQSLLASLGFSCGFAASFNAPLAGITFAMEELQHVSTRLTQATIYMIMVAAALSTAVARATAGNYQLFKPTWSTEDMMESIEGGSIDKILGEKMWMLIAVPIAVACSLCGYVISRCNCLLHRMFQKYRPVAPLPVAFALQALVTASLGALVFHVTGLRGVWGIGAESLQIAMTKTIPLGHLALFAVGKGVALVLGMAVRCPADLLEPVLITGGFVGGAIGSLLPQDSELLEHGTVMPCIIFGMVGLFASCFRFSLTPIVIVLEIVGTESYSLILPAVLCGFTASTCSDVLFPALLEEVLVQDGIDLEELAAQAEETFEADDAAREREESEEESETASRWLERYGSTSAKSQKSKTSKSSVGDSEGSPGSPPAPSRQNSDAPLRFLRRGLEESLYQQSKAKAGTLRDLNGLLRSNSRHHRSPTMRHSLRKMTHESRGSTQEHALRVHESAGKLEVPLQGLRSPVDLRLALHEAIDDHGKRKYYLEVSNARAGSHPKDTLEYRGDLGCRSQSLLSIEERPNKSSNPAAASPAMDVQALGHSLSGDVGADGIFIPPVPGELMQGLPNCYSYWPLCAGHVDWTTFVDFTNVAAAGERLGWRKLFYGPQSLLEHLGRRNLSVHGKSYDVPGYAVFANTWLSNHVKNWYGREVLASMDQSAGWQQRWTSFKWLLLQKTKIVEEASPVISFPSWHLDSQEADPCWSFDPSALPLADWIALQDEEDPRVALERFSLEVSEELGPKYALEYEELQLAVRLVDWLVATEGCQNFKPHQAQRLFHSEGLWQTLRSRLMRAWRSIWGQESVDRVAQAVLKRLMEPTEVSASPVECVGLQTYVALCEGRGDGSPAGVPLHETLQ